MDGRRKSRTQVSLVARYRSPTVFEFVEEQCFDLSEGGMFIKSKAPAPSGTLLKIECQVAEGPDTITAIARVVWLRETESSEGPRGMGVKFVKLENGSADVITRVLARASQSLPPAAPSPSAPPPSGSTPPKAAAVETPLPAALASTVLAMEPPKAEGPVAASAAAKADAPKADAPKAETPKGTPKAEPKPTAAKPAAAPIAPTSASESGFPTAAWVIAGIVIVVLVVVATSSKDQPREPRVITQPPAAATAQPAATPPEAPTTEPNPTGDTPPATGDTPPATGDTPPATGDTPPAALAPAPAPEVASPSPAPTPAPPATPTSGYVVSVVSTPRGATIAAADQTCTAPCSLRFSDLSAPIKVNAEKPRHHPTAATVTAQDPFTERDGALHRTLYLKLHPEAAAQEPAAAPAEAPTETQ